MGEGWGEGEYSVISRTYLPLPLIPSHQGRGNSTFYEFIKFNKEKHGKEIRMSIEIDNNFPLMAIPIPKANALQKESTSYLPSKKPQDSIILDNMIEPEPNNFWEKGTFIDLYI